MGPVGAEFLICGGGILGLTIARALAEKGFSDIVIIEKEAQPGLHASGRNSGVLHAGIYYTPDTLRACSCLKGNILMKQYCRERGLPLSECGKIIVASNESELEVLEELRVRAVNNGADVEMIDGRQLSEVEPIAKTFEKALWSHDTAVVDPRAVIEALTRELTATGRVRILTETEFIGLKGSETAVTSGGMVRFGLFINSAGAYSDRVAHRFGIGRQFRILPFKGLYRKLRAARAALVRGNIYPVPDMRNPFLGIHMTRTVAGEVSVGPTAMPAFGREHYGLFEGMDCESLPIILREAMLLATNKVFRETALAESRKYRFGNFFSDARKLVKELSPDDILPSEKVGIRPQLIDWTSKKLLMDFLVIRDGPSIHVLNAISPGFTSSMAFAEDVVDQYVEPAS